MHPSNKPLYNSYAYTAVSYLYARHRWNAHLLAKLAVVVEVNCGEAHVCLFAVGKLGRNSFKISLDLSGSVAQSRAELDHQQRIRLCEIQQLRELRFVIHNLLTVEGSGWGLGG